MPEITCLYLGGAVWKRTLVIKPNHTANWLSCCFNTGFLCLSTGDAHVHLRMGGGYRRSVISGQHEEGRCCWWREEEGQLSGPVDGVRQPAGSAHLSAPLCEATSNHSGWRDSVTKPDNNSSDPGFEVIIPSVRCVFFSSRGGWHLWSEDDIVLFFFWCCRAETPPANQSAVHRPHLLSLILYWWRLQWWWGKLR